VIDHSSSLACSLGRTESKTHIPYKEIVPSSSSTSSESSTTSSQDAALVMQAHEDQDNNPVGQQGTFDATFNFIAGNPSSDEQFSDAVKKRDGFVCVATGRETLLQAAHLASAFMTDQVCSIHLSWMLAMPYLIYRAWMQSLEAGSRWVVKLRRNGSKLTAFIRQ
jgi:hypothetical protein